MIFDSGSIQRRIRLYQVYNEAQKTSVVNQLRVLFLSVYLTCLKQ